MKTTRGEVLLRQVPPHLIDGIRVGEFKVFGSVVRSAGTGQIKAHLQETTGLARLAGQIAAAPLGIANIGVDVVGHTVSYVQNEQIKAAVAILQNLQLFDLALGAAGIGVSIAGFAALSARIGRVEEKIDGMATQLEGIARKVDALRADRIADDFSRLRTAVQQMDEGWRLVDPKAQWREVAREAHALANAFERRALEARDASQFDALAAEPLMEALSIACATRVSARLAAGDEVVARQAAEEGANALVKLGRGLCLSDIALARLRAKGTMPGSAQWGEALHQVSDEVRTGIEAVRSYEMLAATTVLNLIELDRQQISGRVWLEAARSEEESPLLCLLARDAEISGERALAATLPAKSARRAAN